LTAFAPHTIGIPVNSGKDMEVMKQMFDVCILIKHISNFKDFLDTYEKIAIQEIKYCEISVDVDKVLEDTIKVSKNIASRGFYDKEEYQLYVNGIRSLKSHLFDNNYSSNVAAIEVTKILYLSACVLKRQPYKKLENIQRYLNNNFITKDFRALKYLKKIDLEAYAYSIEAEKIIKNK